MDGEFYCIFIENFGTELELKGDYKEEGDKEKEGEKKGLETWAIALIIVASIILLLIIIIIIILCRKKKKLSNKEIEDKIENLNEFKEM